MSAAEKLRALPPESVGAAALLGLPLPQIVAVVEAAEFFSESNGAAWPEVPTALAALDEALT